ncbi:tryptophan synthase subunit alpha [Streptomyces sp. NPDC048251]|uniref:tryptophan synthase subunit alpha n=1 Tax=Streptomyces sp. NPDC048251 TaxID=3154501 RepID=UPI00342DC6D6
MPPPLHTPDRLTAALSHTDPALGVFLPAGFPAPGLDLEALQAFAAAGARILEVGLPHHDAIYDGPVITEAYQHSLRHGTGVADVLRTVNRAATTTEASVVVISYWAPVLDWGPDHFAHDLAAAGATGAMIADLPADEAGPWLTAARAAGIHSPQFASRRATDTELQHVASTATGWVYAPAVDALTGYSGRIDVPALAAFTERLHTAGPTPVVTGIGVSNPEIAGQIRHLVNGVIIGTRVVQPLLKLGASDGLRTAAGQVAAFADALQPPHPVPGMSAVIR